MDAKYLFLERELLFICFIHILFVFDFEAVRP